ncbi:2-oxoglutarate dehydrogenase E1 component [Alkalilimnicola ehrlichii]|uniref:2-oxoglutarate dehydrogenase E1 component n=1 Tax=Alkalilimnicola ehrlichii TaxID=351052 RepID=A0A3E0WJ54_9GAMM|nr:2-oxoglutarate dehydrogenase E1 component [Alkalilimnicola ehrlichii]RFA24775.1 2-oxoglutarate dehydrogenase E1 component [Alkalilimnicola ehrlichii]RFA31996.1 2-oxoglutarate dehydrogenase E1 component [Alkalilimnicola ehrlichii]
MKGLFEKLKRSSYLGGSNAAFIEDLYEDYLRDPDSVGNEWKYYFQGLETGDSRPQRDVPHGPIREEFARRARASGRIQRVVADGGLSPEAAEKQAAVLRLINAYRVRGHQKADIDPLNLRPPIEIPDLDPAFHNLTAADMDRVFNTGSLFVAEQLSLRDILQVVREVYSGTIGSEYMHITDTVEKRWIQERLESNRAKLNLTPEKKIEVLERVTAGEGIEKYLHSKYVGQKRFSLEGGESLIPMLDYLIQHSGRHGIREMVLGMAHRGRLNVLINILGKSPKELFAEFEGNYNLGKAGSGDVKYHLGYSSDILTDGGPLHLAMAFNPSHLEIVDPVVVGSARARMQRRHDHTGDEVMPVLIHGDAAFAGQGVVMETFQLSQARGFYTGGTVHIIVNNQIGFTTSNPLDARSTFYSTEVAKMVQAPIFHVNGDDPEAVLFVTQLAFDYRQRFKKDVVIDLICYRRHGHNEADEPSATQPVMYSKIKSHDTVRQLYGKRLVAESILDESEVDDLAQNYRDALDNHQIVARNIMGTVHNDYAVDWTPYFDAKWDDHTETKVPISVIRDLQENLQRLPEGFELNPRVAAIMESRRKMAAGALALDWGFAETMAYATLLNAGYKVRLTGQDSGRGTFFHRHAVLHNAKDGDTYIPLKDITTEPTDFTVIDSLLSEEAVMGFEYGFSTADPTTMVIWEAQFGDFANGAQVVIDQFIVSGEAKWGRLCGLTLYLPHGYEGQGPEHSSARLERFLQLCAEHNIQVCVPSTPAQFFHMIRRQMLRSLRKPLVVMTPKSLLRHKLSTSSLDDLTEGKFQLVIDEIDDLSPKKVDRVVLCSGKVYFDLLLERRKRELDNVAILRVEQLYPFPEKELSALLRRRYSKATEVVWCQEEPKNQGAWYSSQHHFLNCMREEQTLRYAGRDASASPAAGYAKLHHEQQRKLVDEALS